ncbi:CSTF2 factor, partial [Nothoprocta ornata]|nr:CSTF2 factor [Nothoprocta ornata]
RLVYDRETGKPKGYGFCEYQDQETALSAMRNLNGREFSGRALRVDNAASEKNKEELKSLGTGAPIIESPYGDPVNPEDAPESISRAVASLPPEQMFELMKQMKLCVQNSPQEARNMLLQNPQLAYALLQAQVVMRIVDPEIALKILHRQTSVPPLIPGSQQAVPVPGPGPGPGPGPNAALNPASTAAAQPQPIGGLHVNGAPALLQPPLQGAVPAPGAMAAAVQGPGPLAPGGGLQPQVGIPGAGPVALERGQVPMPDPRAPMQRGPLPASGPPPRGLLGDAPNDPRGGTLLSVTGEVEPRGYLGPPHQGAPLHHMPGHDSRGPPHEMRGGPMGEPRPLMGEPRGPLMDARGERGGMKERVAGSKQRLRVEPAAPTQGATRGFGQPMGRDPRGLEPRGLEPRVLEPRVLEPRVLEPRVLEPRVLEARAMEARVMEPRGLEPRGPGPNPRGPMPGGIQGPGPLNMGASGPQGPRQVPTMAGAGMQGGGIPGAGVQGAGQPGGFSPGQSQVTPQDHEKAALIMQVLQLTADQIAMLPPEQRQSILILKEQIQKSTGAP